MKNFEITFETPHGEVRQVVQAENYKSAKYFAHWVGMIVSEVNELED